MRYWLSRGEGEVIGPFTRQELEAMAARGELVGPSGVMPQVCPEGEGTWRPVSMVPELAGMLEAARTQVGASSPSLWPPSPVPGVDPLHGVPFTFSTAFDLGWKTFTSRYGLLMGVTVMAIAASILGSLIIMGIDVAANSSRGATALVLHLVSLLTNLGFTFFVNVPLGVGTVWVAVRLVRGEAAEFADLFVPYRRLFHVLAAAILLSLLLGASMLPGVALLVGGIAWTANSNGSAGGIALIVLGACAAILPVLVLAVRLAPAYLLVVDPKASESGALGPIQSISSAWMVTQGHTGRLVGLGAVVALIVLATVLACLIPWLLFGNPLSMAIYGAAYALMVKRDREFAAPA